MLRTGRLLPPSWLSTLRFDAGRSPRRRQPATGLPGDYPDRTPTGWRTQACGHARSRHEPHLLPDGPDVPSGHAVELAALDDRVVEHVADRAA